MPALKDIWPSSATESSIAHIEINALCDDSRKVKTGDAFFAISPSKEDNQHYIQAALSQGAHVIFHQSDTESIDWKDNTPIIHLKNCREILGEVASRYYGEPSKKMKVMGVTGTNGKTSVCHLLAQALSYLGHTVAVLGTTGNGVWPNLKPSALTTLGVIALHQQLAEFVTQGVEVVAMEVSSHGLHQARVVGVTFDIGMFTNLSRDHLDYHGTMEAYAADKRSFFDLPMHQAIVNVDDDYGKAWLSTWPVSLSVIQYGKTNGDFQLLTTQQLDRSASELVFKTPLGKLVFKTKLLGEFNFYNLLVIAVVLFYKKYDAPAIIKALESIQPVLGRMQQFIQPGKPMVVVDYSHTPDALAKALQTLRSYCNGKLVCIFGCGGDRDKGKRPMMAETAEKYADYCIVTNDNPRFEDSEKIITDILAGFTDTKEVKVMNDRKQAIVTTIQSYGDSDIILVAGKGHEDYQIVKDQYLKISDIQIVKQALGME